MKTFSSLKPTEAVEKRLLDFLNSIHRPEIIADLDLLLIQGDKADYGIGPVVAERILAKKNSLSPRLFKSIEQLDDIEGLGQDKAQDLLTYLSMPRGEVFVQMMRNHVLPSSWELFVRVVNLKDAPVLDLNGTAFREWLADEVIQMATEEPDGKAKVEIKRQLVNAYVDEYEIAHVASYAMALWFYRFDQDNWGPFENYRTQAEEYLGFANETNRLQFYKGFDNGLIMKRGITVDDLMVVHNESEHTLSIYASQLMD